MWRSLPCRPSKSLRHTLHGFCLLCFDLLFSTWIHCIAKASPELPVVLVPLPPDPWRSRQEPLTQAWILAFGLAFPLLKKLGVELALSLHGFILRFPEEVVTHPHEGKGGKQKNAI